jgi:hypothetical protein
LQIADTRLHRQGPLAGENDGFQAAIILDGGIVGMAGDPSVDWDNRSTRIGYCLDEGAPGQRDRDRRGSSDWSTCRSPHLSGVRATPAGSTETCSDYTIDPWGTG